MADLSIFTHPEMGAIRVTDKDGAPWFVATDVAKRLGYKNPTWAIKEHCKEVTQYKLPIYKTMCNIISEADLYRLIMNSKLPSAEKFKDWVVEEVLPQIRRTGMYTMTPDAPTETSVKSNLPISQLEAHLDEALRLAKKLNYDETEAVVYACSLLQEHYGIHLTPAPPKAINGEVGTFIPTTEKPIGAKVKKYSKRDKLPGMDDEF